MSNLTYENKIEQALMRASDILRGSIDPSNFTSKLIFLLFLRYVTVVQKNASIGQHCAASHFDRLNRISLPHEMTFWELFKYRNSPGFSKRIDQAISKIENANGELTGIFQDIGYRSDSHNLGNHSNEILSKLIFCIADDAFDFLQTKARDQYLITHALEFLLTKISAPMSKGSSEHLTPKGVSELVARLVQPKNGDSIYDPVCGSGSMLLRCVELASGESASDETSAYGQEKNSSTWGIARLNFLMHLRDPGHLFRSDALREPMLRNIDNSLMQFDIAIGNPPYSMHWESEIADHDNFGRFNMGTPPKNRADYAFILHMLASIKDATGRMAVVVPHGVLFRGGAEGSIRKNLIEENLIDTIIGLPPKLFLNTAISTVLLLIRKNKMHKNILFIDGSREFQANKIQNSLNQSHIVHIVETFRKREEKKGYSRLVTIDEIKKNNYNLNIPLYVHSVETEEKIDIGAIRAESSALKIKIETIEYQLRNALNELR